MANEGVIIEAPVLIRNFTVPNSIGVEKGTLMIISGARGAIPSTGFPWSGAFAGIAYTEKTVSDGSTTLGLAKDGVYDIKMASDSVCKEGELLIISGMNTVAPARNMVLSLNVNNMSPLSGLLYSISSGMIVGKSMEDGSASEVIAVEVGRII